MSTGTERLRVIGGPNDGEWIKVAEGADFIDLAPPGTVPVQARDAELAERVTPAGARYVVCNIHLANDAPIRFLRLSTLTDRQALAWLLATHMVRSGG